MAKQISLLRIAVLTSVMLFPACQKTLAPPASQTAASLTDDYRVVRVFDIDDLLKSKWLTDSGSADTTAATQPAAERIEPEQLIARIKQAIGWKETEGAIQIRDGKLIVNATRKAQQQIFSALNDIRTGSKVAKAVPIASTQPNPAAPIKPGDVVRICIYDLAQPGQEYLKEATISDKGTVDILYLGDVKLVGLSPSRAAQKIGQLAVEKHAILPAGKGGPGPQVTVTRADAIEKQAWDSR